MDVLCFQGAGQVMIVEKEQNGRREQKKQQRWNREIKQARKSNTTKNQLKNVQCSQNENKYSVITQISEFKM